MPPYNAHLIFKCAATQIKTWSKVVGGQVCWFKQKKKEKQGLF